MDARLPNSIGRFRVLSLLGRGAMGVVYKGHDPSIGRTVAIKVVRADLLAGPEGDNYVARFHDEARIAALCHHANIVGVLEFYDADGQPYLVMEYVDGIPLSRAMPRGTQISLPEAIYIVLQLLDALANVHAAGVTHCDIKPANILLTRAARLKITDFGISRVTDAEPAGIPLTIGTPSYMSPEQCLGEPVDYRSDFFSIGAVLYELLTGARPFQGPAHTGTVFKLVNQRHRALTTLRPDLSLEVSDIIDRALAKAPADRFPDAESFAAALRSLALTEDTPAVIFGMRHAGGFALFNYATPVALAAEAQDDPKTVLWGAPQPGPRSEAELMARGTEAIVIATVPPVSDERRPASPSPPKRRRQRLPDIAWCATLMPRIATHIAGLRAQREQD